MLCHICTASEWEAAQASGIYRAASLETEGFIHCSTLAQVLPVANSFYKDQDGLVDEKDYGKAIGVHVGAIEETTFTTASATAMSGPR